MRAAIALVVEPHELPDPVATFFDLDASLQHWVVRRHPRRDLVLCAKAIDCDRLALQAQAAAARWASLRDRLVRRARGDGFLPAADP